MRLWSKKKKVEKDRKKIECPKDPTENLEKACTKYT